MQTQATARARKTVIESIRIEHIPDDSPDTSFLGEYTDSPDGWHWDRQSGELRDGDGELLAAGLMNPYSRGESQYVHGFQNSGSVKEWAHVSDSHLARAWLSIRYRANGNEQGLRGNLFAHFEVVGWQNAHTRKQKIKVLDVVYCCLAAYRLYRGERGDWHYIGVRARAEIRTQSGNSQTITSAGLWGIESDSSPEYLREIADEELAQLRTELESLDISQREIARAFKHVERP